MTEDELVKRLGLQVKRLSIELPAWMTHPNCRVKVADRYKGDGHNGRLAAGSNYHNTNVFVNMIAVVSLDWMKLKTVTWNDSLPEQVLYMLESYEVMHSVDYAKIKDDCVTVAGRVMYQGQPILVDDRLPWNDKKPFTQE